jgi:hypothetical protein
MSRTMDRDRIKKLPAWAQHLIDMLERDVADAEKRAARGWQEERPEDPCIERTIFTAHPFKHQYLPMARYERMLVGNLEISVRDGELTITSRDSSIVCVVPVCSNMITIEEKQR